MVFLNDTLTHWAWVIPIALLIGVELFYLPNNGYKMYAFIFAFMALIIFIFLGKLMNLFGPTETTYRGVVIRGEYTDSHQSAYIIFIAFLIVFIIISVILSGLSIKKGNIFGS